MNITSFKMSEEDAYKKIQAYRIQLKRRANAEYELALRAYEIVAKGYAIVNLVEAFAQTGLGSDNRPKLAIARADRQEVHVFVDVKAGRLSFSTHSRGMWLGNYSGDLLVRVSYQFTSEQIAAKELQYGKSGFALVPMIPADVRSFKGQDQDYMILWEVEQWADRSHTSPAPRDPYLLKLIAGDLYAVVTEWDLTDLERAIMSGRNRN